MGMHTQINRSLRYLVLISFVITAALVSPPSKASATFPGQPGKILYQDVNGQYFTVNPDGSGSQAFLSNDHAYVSFSPDGTQILYKKTSSSYLYTASSSGTNEVQQKIINGYQPTWLPNGQSIYYRSSGGFKGQTPAMYQDDISVDSNDKHLVSTYDWGELAISPDGDKKVGSQGLQTGFSTGNVVSSQFYYSSGTTSCTAFSPDSNRISFLESVNSGISTHYLKIVSPEGITLKSYQVAGAPMGCPAWSPNGGEIALSIDTDSNPNDSVHTPVLVAINANTGQQRTILAGAQGVVDWQVMPTTATPYSYSYTGRNVYRLYQPYINKHLYTTDGYEEFSLVDIHFVDVSQESGWNSEKVSFRVRPEKTCSAGNSVYRFYSQALKTHLLTMDESEKAHLIGLNDPGIWQYEGVGFCADATKVAGTVPVYRFYSEVTKEHLYTVDEHEKDVLIGYNDPAVWRYEGVAFYAYPVPSY